MAERESGQASALRRRFLVQYEDDLLRQRPLWIRILIEIAGTFLLVMVAAGAGVINHYVGGHPGPISRTAAVVAPALLVMALIYAWGPLSGLHINPAVTFAFTTRGVFPVRWVLPYWSAQFAGAILGALFLRAVYGDVAAGGNYPIAKPGGDWRALVMEILLTTILVSVVLHTAVGARSIGHNAALAVGGAIALLGLFASPISGASMNPARTLGPDVAAMNFTGWWVYVVGPLAGACIAVMFINLIRGLPNKAEIRAAEGSVQVQTSDESGGLTNHANSPGVTTGTRGIAMNRSEHGTDHDGAGAANVDERWWPSEFGEDDQHGMLNHITETPPTGLGDNKVNWVTAIVVGTMQEGTHIDGLGWHRRPDDRYDHVRCVGPGRRPVSAFRHHGAGRRRHRPQASQSGTLNDT